MSSQLAQILDLKNRLEARFDELSQELRKLKVRPHQPPKTEYNSRRHNRTSPDENPDSDICWFRCRYGRSVRQCAYPVPTGETGWAPAEGRHSRKPSDRRLFFLSPNEARRLVFSLTLELKLVFNLHQWRTVVSTGVFRHFKLETDL